ncbi:GNAT family N-acetyltransferase [Sporosarcina sp. P18a]|uniref:GNAT family N-acetyltransferase n=1 Tax=Sporosarcina sp. P18a TaxID=2048259 RepID=UPI0013046A2C|nr:GNAT family N-acetyltransferase [Sporosarcina sp. P18a]
MELLKEEVHSIWDTEKENIFAEIAEGTFEDLSNLELGTPLYQEWWKLIDENGRILGYGWVSYRNDDFEISLVVDTKHQGVGLGSFIMDKLEAIAVEKGFNEIVAIVKNTNPNSEVMIKWLFKKGYVPYWLGFEGLEPKSQEFAISGVKKSDIRLIKKL